MSEPSTRDLELLAELFKTGGWQELRVEAEAFSLLFSNDASAGGAQASGGRHGAIAAGKVSSPAARVEAAAPAPDRTAAPVAPEWHAVTAPNLGTFYRSPKPGSPAFVELGQRVTADTEICLIEVMKLFTSVKAGTAGTIRSIDARDAELVEGGQTLFHIEPE